MSYRVYAEKPAISMCVSGLSMGMAIWYTFKLIRIGMKVTVEKDKNV